MGGAIEWGLIVAALTCSQLRDVQQELATQMVTWIDILESPRCRYKETTDVHCKVISGLLIEARPQADEVDVELAKRCSADGGS